MTKLKNILLEKNHRGIQFFKYACCGGIAFGVDIVVFYLVAVFVFPALTENDFFVELFGLTVTPVSETVRLHNFWIGKGLSFIASNITAYILNVLFVFKGGKHKVHKEVALFFGVSFVAFLLSTWSGDALIRFFGVQTTICNFTAIFSAILINYCGRKFFVFHG